jgi:hypothetical protein
MYVLFAGLNSRHTENPSIGSKQPKLKLETKERIAIASYVIVRLQKQTIVLR